MTGRDLRSRRGCIGGAREQESKRAKEQKSNDLQLKRPGRFSPRPFRLSSHYFFLLLALLLFAPCCYLNEYCSLVTTIVPNSGAPGIVRYFSLSTLSPLTETRKSRPPWRN